MPKESQKEYFGCFLKLFGCHVDIKWGKVHQTHVGSVYVMFILFPCYSELNL